MAKEKEEKRKIDKSVVNAGIVAVTLLWNPIGLLGSGLVYYFINREPKK